MAAGGDWEKTGKEAKWTHIMLQFITAPQSTLQTQPPHMNITGKRPYHLMNNTNKALEIHSTRLP